MALSARSSGGPVPRTAGAQLPQQAAQVPLRRTTFGAAFYLWPRLLRKHLAALFSLPRLPRAPPREAGCGLSPPPDWTTRRGHPGSCRATGVAASTWSALPPWLRQRHRPGCVWGGRLGDRGGKRHTSAVSAGRGEAAGGTGPWSAKDDEPPAALGGRVAAGLPCLGSAPSAWSPSSWFGRAEGLPRAKDLLPPEPPGGASRSRAARCSMVALLTLRSAQRPGLRSWSGKVTLAPSAGRLLGSIRGSAGCTPGAEEPTKCPWPDRGATDHLRLRGSKATPRKTTNLGRFPGLAFRRGSLSTAPRPVTAPALPIRACRGALLPGYFPTASSALAAATALRRGSDL
jgi:hypothetical protein